MFMKKNKEEKYVLEVAPRKNGDFLNVYIYIDGYRFELVPHCRTMKEKAYFYGLLKRKETASAE